MHVPDLSAYPDFFAFGFALVITGILQFKKLQSMIISFFC